MLKKTILAVCALMLCALSVFAQEQTTPKTGFPGREAGNGKSYEVLLQVLIASNETGVKNDLPNSLQEVVKKLKTSLPQTNYRLAATSFGRIRESGSFESKSVAGAFSNSTTLTNQPTFYEISLNALQSEEIAGKSSLQVQHFSLGARIPIVTAVNNGNQVTNYEKIGITLRNLTLREGVPTVVGSMATKADEMLIAVLTVREESK